MRTLKATLLGLFCSSMVFGQVTTMNVYQSNGVLLQIPVSVIDSVTLSTAPPPSMSIYQTGGSVSTIVVANIDSITYTVGGNPLPPGSISGLSCSSANDIGTLTDGISAISVSSEISYSGGNGGWHNGQVVSSTDVTGLTATLSTGNFNNGNGLLTYAISGTPNGSGEALFLIDVGGQSCTLSRFVNLPVGSIGSLSCGNSNNIGSLTEGTLSSGVTSLIPYTGGNGGTHSGQVVNSSGVLGLTATLLPDTFEIGNGFLSYVITGTPSASGYAYFTIDIGGQTCVLERSIAGGGIISTPGAGVSFNGYNYPTIVLGNGQEWMAENLRTEIYANGDNLNSTLNGGVSEIGYWVIDTLQINITGSGWCGDVEEPSLFGQCQGAPEPMVEISQLFDSLNFNWLNVLDTTPYISDTLFASWYNLTSLSSIGSNLSVLRLTVFDDDTVSQLDNLGEVLIEFNGPGTYSFSSNEYNGSITISPSNPNLWLAQTNGAWCFYENNIQYEEPYGKLYNWFATTDSRNVCPANWHVPTDLEWTTMIDYLGGENSAGGILKSIGTQFWQSPNGDATNEIGFSGLPGGYRDGNFSNNGYLGFWWSSTQESQSDAHSRGLNNDDGVVENLSSPKTTGYSIRCIKD